MSHIAVVGAGYVGLTTAACLADLGNKVCVIDIDDVKIRALRRHRLHFYEPGLQEVVQRNGMAGRLNFTTVYSEAVAGAGIAFIAVATPEGEGGEANLDHVRSAAASIAEHLTGPIVIVNKSTVPIGTGDFVSEVFQKHQPQFQVDVVSNPEFLREGSALHDFMKPDRVVIGANNEAAADQVAKLYEPLNAPILRYNLYTAEMVKYASNAFLAARISFINEISRICERVDADAKRVAEGMGLDKRIGPHFLEAGIGYGGSCFPKDVKALAAIAERFNYHPELLHAVMAINRDQRTLAVEKLRECLGTLRGQRIGLFGLAFKPNTDDMREAPSLEIAHLLLQKGAKVCGYDPAAGKKAKALLPELDVRRDAYAVARDADAVVVVTEWNEFRQLDLAKLKRAMRRPVVVDGRNIYDPARMRSLGFVYRGIGRN
ncbi:MAG: UDP-glucose dehydrogenase family protein [Candidatus Dormibacter sp.]|uniref:UDP-glucose dehydrogenase family protein n=1 Tax=Candidatus Dormibacter sp. TaxID=2973982 RepID=UPI000DB7271E|nr:MAG: UDP-glucose 6-dehydrogenase [Candidatus Dormibacteraeota bacterium]